MTLLSTGLFALRRYTQIGIIIVESIMHSDAATEMMNVY